MQGDGQKRTDIKPIGAPIVLFGSDVIGRGDDVVGSVLAMELIIDFSTQKELPATLVFYNGGAKLTMGDSPVIDNLRELDRMGVEILTDSVSAEFFESGGGVAVGNVIDPYVIASLLTAQSGVITF